MVLFSASNEKKPLSTQYLIRLDTILTANPSNVAWKVLRICKHESCFMSNKSGKFGSSSVDTRFLLFAALLRSIKFDIGIFLFSWFLEQLQNLQICSLLKNYNKIPLAHVLPNHQPLPWKQFHRNDMWHSLLQVLVFLNLQVRATKIFVSIVTNIGGDKIKR